MAATAAHVFKDKKNNNGNQEITRHEVQSAIAKAVELRALHAALMRGNNPTNAIFSFPSPAPRSVSHFSAHDYPVFTPIYEDGLVYNQNSVKSLTISTGWDENVEGNSLETIVTDYKEKSSLRNGLSHHLCPADDAASVTGSCADQITVLQTSPANDYFKCRWTNDSEDFRSVSSCNKGKPTIKASEFENARNSKSSNIVVSVTESQSSFQSQTKGKGLISRMFPQLKRNKNGSSPNTAESEDVSQVLKDLGVMSLETLKKELVEANENRDAALMEVSEMKSLLMEMKQKLEYLESYCEELKKASKQAINARDSQLCEQLNNLPQRGKSFHENGESLMPMSEEVMVEVFLQIVSESRLSVKQFCKTIINNIGETDRSLAQNLNLTLQPNKLPMKSKYSKAVLYHFEAFINQSLYQDFDNCVFQKHGCPKFLDPQQDRQAQFSSFVSLRNLSWNEVLRKGTKYYSEEFSKFCDQKMSCIVTRLSWKRPWPEQLLQAFFVAAKCMWLLHLLAFSFNPPLRILRVEENRNFDPHYMEDMCPRSQGPSRVKIMVMPGFYVQDRVLKCKVLCRYKSAA
ncbi:hypothetical protein TanjilG_03338 [Lupinus angustifolius]|uniref:DUF641 domain-containing protein n=1 Tax=Lupinus angustifolius TaxID=3871 RepID=A0A4P1RDC9_LUPAN|nr:PREDICTED: IRK-interacting protein-like [Lupinus angustifolius]OIW08662.1 hypothetical protein TanjilG_03338 [Lupinus angustifolius]